MKLLFIGNSHTYYNDMPAFVLRLLEATGKKSHVTMLAQGGKWLDYHADVSTVPFNITYGNYDFVLVQERATQFDRELFMKGAERLLDMVQKTDSQFVLYMPWAKSNERHLQKEMTDAHLYFAHKHGVRFAAVGETFTRLLQSENVATLYRDDANHASAIGSYAAAVTIFYTITGRKRILNPTEINDPGIAVGFPPELCRKIHNEACYITRLFNG